jgi:hypothetical protein
MEKFMLLFRNDNTTDFMPTPEERQATMQKWIDWLNTVAAQGNLVDKGKRLDDDGKVVKPGNLITDGPYTESKESIGGYTVIQTGSLDEAAAIAKGCPILTVGGNVEIRRVIDMNS